MTTPLDDALVFVLADFETGNPTGEGLVAWAATALEQGHDSPSLRILASLTSDAWLSEAEPYFRRALTELRVQTPPRRELLLRYLRIVARDMLNGKIPAQRATHLIHSRVVSPLNHPAEIQRWCYLWEGLHPDDFHSIEGDEHRAAVEAEARQWVE